MKLDMAITDLFGVALTDGATVKTCVINALMVPLKGDDNLSGVEKLKLFNLAKKIHDADEIELLAEDVAKIKERVGKAYAPLIVGRVFAAIDPAENA